MKILICIVAIAVSVLGQEPTAKPALPDCSKVFVGSDQPSVTCTARELSDAVNESIAASKEMRAQIAAQAAKIAQLEKLLAIYQANHEKLVIFANVCLQPLFDSERQIAEATKPKDKP